MRLGVARGIIVTVVTAAAVLAVGLDLRYLIGGGSFGLRIGYNGYVRSVAAGSPAARAGVAIGDRVGFAAISPKDRARALYADPAVPGARLVARFVRGGKNYDVTLVADRRPIAGATLGLGVAREVALLAAIAIGTSLLVLRPSPATWVFYAYCAALTFGGARSLYAMRFPWWIGGIVIFDIANAAAPIALTIFALRFLRREPTARRDRAEVAAIAAFVVLAGLNIEPDLAVVLAAQPSQAVENAAYLFIPLAYVAAALAFALSYLESAAAARGRLLWAIGGLCFQPIAIGAYYVMTLTALGNRIATITDFNVTLALETIATIFGPGIVAYAIVKRRVVDIRFIISRALVYSVLTAGIITTFGLVEWWVGQLLEKTRLALVLNLGIAIAVGFWLNGLHAGLDRLIDKLLFRRRHRAEERLVRVTAGLPHAESLAGLDEIVVCEPFEALELTSSAVFRRDSEVPFHRTASRGWTDADVVTLTSEHRWFVHLQGQQGPLRLRELPADQGFPHGDLAPVLAVPLVLRRVLIAIAFYGPHRSGEDLDADEVAAIARMGTAAALAYDAVAHDAVRTRVRPRDQALDELAEAVEAQARTIEAQQRTIADLRRERVAGAES